MHTSLSWSLTFNCRHFGCSMLCFQFAVHIQNVKTISSPADCEIRAVIKFLNARNVKPAKIYRQVTEVYGEYAISDGMVR
ncbi:hypothetical protein X975_11606, partial [Stegodyphus mimosarum]